MDKEEIVLCSVCGKRYKNKHSVDSHILDCHDGGARRVDKLACPVGSCGAEFQSRIRYEGHLRSKHAKSEAVPHLCSLCDQSFVTGSELDRHLDDHQQHQEQEGLTACQSDADTEAVQSLRPCLISHIGSIHTANYLMNMTCPIVLSMEGGGKIAVLGVPEMAEHLLRKKIVHSDVLTLTGEAGRTDVELSQALMAHRYGGLVQDRLKSYGQLGTKVCQKRFSEASEPARLLAGCLIQSQANVVLVLKGRNVWQEPDGGFT